MICVIIKIQGYENYALDDLLYDDCIDENDIVNGTDNVPEIWYKGANNKKRRHYVDLYIPNQKKCIEVKSKYTDPLYVLFLLQMH